MDYFSVLKKYPSLIPLFVTVGIGMSAAVLYPLRCALKSPDVSWSKRKNPEPWNEYTDRQYKLLSTGKMDPAKKPELPSY